MRRKRRSLNPFGLAFLDVMSCGFGAAILVFMLIKHNSAELALETHIGGTDTLQSQSDIESLEARIQQLIAKAAFASQEILSIQDRIVDAFKTIAVTEAQKKDSDDGELEALKKQLKKRQAGLLKEKEKGAQLTKIKGDGKRQYLTGLHVKGKHILIIFDRSASMLDDELVNIIRGKFLPAAERRKAGKWKWSNAILRWLLAHLPENSHYQVLGFNDKVSFLGKDKKWIKAKDEKLRKEVLQKLNTWAPENGTNLRKAFSAARTLSPPPDAIYLITDGLPTLQASKSKPRLVSSNERLNLFSKAIDKLPHGVPVHTILLPTKGDPHAAGAFWQLAVATGGRFLAPPWDWP